MGNDQQAAPGIGLVDVVFVGGPFHGRRMGMVHPEFRMTLELETGERLEYCRRLVEPGGRYGNIATYAPLGVSDEEFSRLVIEAARNGTATNGGAAP